MAAEYADDDDDKVAILDLKKVTLEELKLHDSVMKVSFEFSSNPFPFFYAQSFYDLMSFLMILSFLSYTSFEGFKFYNTPFLIRHVNYVQLKSCHFIQFYSTHFKYWFTMSWLYPRHL